jgi:hypothetical protein
MVKTMKKYVFLLALLSGFGVFVSLVQAQNDLSELNPEEYFNFWLGEWKLTWEDADGTTANGTNHIEKVLDGAVIKENFEAHSGSFEGYKGKSYSVYNPQSGQWHQTWVDNNGGYLDFRGEIEGNKRIFKRKGLNPMGEEILQRMVFYDITENSLTWDWEISSDNGQTWQLRWRIFYERVLANQ